MQKSYRIGNDDLPAFVAVNPDGTPIGASSGSTGAATIADGADVAQGAKADAAYTGTGAASIVGILKGVYAACVGATPAGSNVIGKVQVADGGNVTQGAIADALATSSTGSWSVVALLKGIYAQLVLTVAGLAAATPAGSNVIGGVTEADGANITLGSKADTSWTGGPGTVIAVLKGIFGAVTGTLKVQGVVWWQEANNTSLAANGVFSGTIRANPAATAGTAGSAAYFQVILYATMSCTGYIIQAGLPVAQVSLTAGIPQVLKVPALAASFYGQINNNATAGTVYMYSGYTN